MMMPLPENEPCAPNGTVTLSLAGQTAWLMPQRALYLPDMQTLFIADIHLGKTAAFRAQAIPLPHGSSEDDLARLATVVAQTGARHLYILGDLLHAYASQEARTDVAFRAWRAAHEDLAITLVRGNHDISAGDPPESWGIECIDPPFDLPPFSLLHDPDDAKRALTPWRNESEPYQLAGHLHPSYVLEGRGKQSYKLPCFWMRPKIGILPAFGAFTGGAAMTPERGDRVYLIVESAVMALPEKI